MVKTIIILSCIIVLLIGFIVISRRRANRRGISADRNSIDELQNGAASGAKRAREAQESVDNVSKSVGDAGRNIDNALGIIRNAKNLSDN